LKFTSVQIQLDEADELIVHARKKSVRLFANGEGTIQIDQFDEGYWEKKLGKQTIASR
jgi:hypothetical protein